MKCSRCKDRLAVFGTWCWCCRDEELRRLAEPVGFVANRRWPVTVRGGAHSALRRTFDRLAKKLSG